MKGELNLDGMASGVTAPEHALRGTTTYCNLYLTQSSAQTRPKIHNDLP